MRESHGAVLFDKFKKPCYMIKAGSSILKNYIMEHFEVCVMDDGCVPLSCFKVYD